MTHRTTQPEAVLYFIGDQLLFEHRTTDGAIVRKCISPHTARQAFTHEPLDSGWLSPRVVRWGHNRVGPWCLQRYDPDAYTIRLNPPLVHPTTHAPMQELRVTLPGFLFLGVKRTYFLWAYRAWAHEQTRLYHAPLPNIHDDGHICFGSARAPLVSGHTIADAWHVFWESRFNKDLSRNRTHRHADNVLHLLAELHQPTDTRRPFPTRTLKATSLDLAGLLGQLNQSAETRDR